METDLSIGRRRMSLRPGSGFRPTPSFRTGKASNESGPAQGGEMVSFLPGPTVHPATRDPVRTPPPALPGEYLRDEISKLISLANYTIKLKYIMIWFFVKGKYPLRPAWPPANSFPWEGILNPHSPLRTLLISHFKNFLTPLFPKKPFHGNEIKSLHIQ